MKRIVLIALFLLVWFVPSTLAAESPLAKPNNKMGIHILFDHELSDAAKLVNSNGGEWGYIVIPIQSGDKDLVKWQTFMDKAKELHVIPIIRLATEGDYFNTKVWRRPTQYDIVDFANFLDSLTWPTQNRYIIVFNEVNRADEWGGKVSPEEYAAILSFSTTVFKSKNQNFFILNAGLDNAAPEEYPLYMNQYTYLRRMQESVPGIFNQIDGMASHSYPNPDFSQPPYVDTAKSIYSFQYERDLLRLYRNTDLPVFITETGWNGNLSDEIKAQYLKDAFANVWNDEKIVVVAPFLLRAGDGPFKGFSYLTPGGEKTKVYTAFESIQKIKGTPLIPTQVLSEITEKREIPVKNFSSYTYKENKISLSDTAQTAFKWILKI